MANPFVTALGNRLNTVGNAFNNLKANNLQTGTSGITRTGGTQNLNSNGQLVPSTSSNLLQNLSQSQPYQAQSSLGTQAQGSAQSSGTVKPPANTINSTQVKPATFTTQQNTGLLAALARQQAGTANATDTANLNYAQGKGWKAPTSSSGVSGASGANSGSSGASVTPPPLPPTDISSKGVVTNLVDTTKNQNPNIGASQTGLLNTAQTNPAFTGEASTALQSAKDELAKFQSDLAMSNAGLGNAGNSLQAVTGQQQNLNTANNAKLLALQQKVANAQKAVDQQMTGTQIQQAGYNQAGGLANQAQGLVQSGLTNAGQLVQPVQGQYGIPFVNQQTGQIMNGQGTTAGDINSNIAYWANQVANNRASISDVPASITGNQQLKTQLQQMIQQGNPNYNPSTQSAGQQFAGELTGFINNLQGNLNGVDANFQLLNNTARQGGVNDNNVPALNTLQQNLLKGLTSSASVTNFQSTLAGVRSQYASILGGGTVTVDSQQRAQQAIPDNISLSALESLRIQMKNEADNRIAGYRKQINQLTGSQSGSQNNQSSSSGGIDMSKYSQDANGQWKYNG